MLTGPYAHRDSGPADAVHRSRPQLGDPGRRVPDPQGDGAVDRGCHRTPRRRRPAPHRARPDGLQRGHHPAPHRPATTPPTPAPCCGSSSTPHSLIDSRPAWSPVRPVGGCRPESRLDHDVAAGNDDVAHLGDLRRLLSRWLRQIPGQISHQGNSTLHRALVVLLGSCDVCVGRPTSTDHLCRLTAVRCPSGRTRSQYRDGATTCGTCRAPTG